MTDNPHKLQEQVRRYKQQHRDEQCENCGARLRFHSLRQYITCVKEWYRKEERVELDRQARAALSVWYDVDAATGFATCKGCRLSLPQSLIEGHVLGCDRCDALK